MTWPTTSRQSRGYGARWDKLRLQVLARDRHICQCPQCLGGKLRLRTAGHVDHIKPKAQGGTDDLANLRAVNAECHRRLTLEQQDFQPRRGFDAKGNPL